MRRLTRARLIPIFLLGALAALDAASSQGGAIPGPLPLFPADNWWNLDVSSAPLDTAFPNSVSWCCPASP